MKNNSDDNKFENSFENPYDNSFENPYENSFENPFDESFYIMPEEPDNELNNDPNKGLDNEPETVSTEEQAGESGVVLLNLSGVSSKAEFYERIQEAMEVPDYFGNNLDALYDILTEISSETIIRVTGMDRVTSEMEDYMKKFRELCEDVCEENECVKFIYVDSVL